MPAPCSFLSSCSLALTAALQKLEELQVKDTLRMINNMVELCFSECVTGFRSKAVRPALAPPSSVHGRLHLLSCVLAASQLSSPEEKCINTCAEKFLKHSGRVGQVRHALPAVALAPIVAFTPRQAPLYAHTYTLPKWHSPA